ncbi:MAG TPA: hypothetical protein VKB80_08470 [Kofleriaceae bacterium]|nr:hypothetical protein [Kofleriaceae bacterium]
MTQAGFFALVYAAGLAFNLAWGPRRDAVLACALAFPCGLTFWVLGALLGVATGLASAPAFGLGTLVALVVGSAAASLRRACTPISWTRVAACSAAFVAGAVLVSQFSLAKFSPDSHQFLRIAAVFSRGGRLGETAAFLADRGIFTFLSYAAGELAGVDFMFSLAPVVGLSLAALLAVAISRALEREGVDRRTRLLASAGVTAAVMTTYVIAFHMVYIHANLGSALYLFGFGALFWLAERDGDASLLSPALVCLVAFSIHRVEAPVFAALFAVLAAWPSQLPRRLLAAGLFAFGAITAGWLLLLSAAIPSEGEFLTPGRAVLLSAMSLAPLAGLPLAARLPRALVARHLPTAVLVVASVGLAVTFAIKPHHMMTSLEAVVVNLLGVQIGLFGYAWWAALALGALCLATPPSRIARPLLMGVAVSVIVVVLLGFFRVPYRVGPADSAGRMFIHFLPLLYFLYAVKLVPLRRWRASAAEEAG